MLSKAKHVVSGKTCVLTEQLSAYISVQTSVTFNETLVLVLFVLHQQLTRVKVALTPVTLQISTRLMHQQPMALQVISSGQYGITIHTLELATCTFEHLTTSFKGLLNLVNIRNFHSQGFSD